MNTIAVRPFRYWALRYRSQWIDGLVVSFAQPLLYLGAIGFGLGRLVDANRPESLAGVRFAAFIAPGLMAAAAMVGGAVENQENILPGGKQHSVSPMARDGVDNLTRFGRVVALGRPILMPPLLQRSTPPWPRP